MSGENPYAPPRSEDQPPPLPPGTPPEEQRWPKVIGIISCVIGGGGLVSTPLLVAFNELNPDSQRFLELLPEWFEAYSDWSVGLGMLFSVVLAVAGIMALRKRAAARGLHLLYAWTGIVGVIAGVVATVSAFGGVDDTYLTSAEQAGLIGGMVAGVFGALFGAAYPIFVLVWFGRQKTRNDIAQWVLIQRQETS
jgi:hypothetical protein